MAKHIPHLYVPGPYAPGRIGVVEATRIHLEKVLRNSDPIEVSYTDGAGFVGKGVYSGGWIQRGRESVHERANPVTIGVAPPKNKSRARFVVEKLAEIGVARLLWLAARHNGRLVHVATTRQGNRAQLRLRITRGGRTLRNVTAEARRVPGQQDRWVVASAQGI